MKIKKSAIIIILLLGVLLPGNIMLAVYYWRTNYLASTRFKIFSDTEKVQFLNSNFALVAQPGQETDSFWVLTPHHSSSLEFKNKQILSVGVITQDNYFDWSVVGDNKCYMLSWQGRHGFDLNGDLIFDYCADAKGSYIREQGQWIPVKTIDFNKKIALMPDNSQRIWRHNNWETVPKSKRK